MVQFGLQDYWEDRYQKDKENFDWYQRYTGPIKEIINEHLPKDDYPQILNVGAGNSRFA